MRDKEKKDEEADESAGYLLSFSSIYFMFRLLPAQDQMQQFQKERKALPNDRTRCFQIRLLAKIPADHSFLQTFCHASWGWCRWKGTKKQIVYSPAANDNAYMEKRCG